jgi:DNA-binding response OmpR family regulator
LGDEQDNLSLTVNPSSVVETNYSNEMSVISDESHDGRKRILIADHDVESLSQIKDALEQNYHVRIVKDGEDALRYLRDNDAIDLLMIDLDLPKINGIDMAKQIRELYGENLPVIFLSNRSDRNTVEQCRKIQAVDYILKPFQPVYVLTRVQIALEGKDETLS